MVTIKHIWIGLSIVLFVFILTGTTMMYWQHVTQSSTLSLLTTFIPFPTPIHGC